VRCFAGCLLAACNIPQLLWSLLEHVLACVADGSRACLRRMPLIRSGCLLNLQRAQHRFRARSITCIATMLDTHTCTALLVSCRSSRGAVCRAQQRARRCRASGRMTVVRVQAALLGIASLQGCGLRSTTSTAWRAGELGLLCMVCLRFRHCLFLLCGFVGDRFLTGLGPHEYYFHCVVRRDFKHVAQW
jgi:hypothetical protein